MSTKTLCWPRCGAKGRKSLSGRILESWTFEDPNFVPVHQIEFEILHRENENFNLMGALQEKSGVWAHESMNVWTKIHTDSHWTLVDIFQSEPLDRPGHQQSRADWKAKIKQRLKIDFIYLFTHLKAPFCEIVDCWLRPTRPILKRLDYLTCWDWDSKIDCLINVSFNTKKEGVQIREWMLIATLLLFLRWQVVENSLSGQSKKTRTELKSLSQWNPAFSLCRCSF